MNFSLRGGRLPLYVVILACLLTGIFTYAISSQLKKQTTTSHESNSSTPTFFQNRSKEYKYIQPVIFSETPKSIEKYDALTKELNTIILQHKEKDPASSTSVYIRNLKDGSWTTINETEKFDAGSIFKLSILIALMKKAEKKPGFLEEKTLYKGPNANLPVQTITSATLKKGNSYTVRELIKFMIVDSDNEANLLLYSFIDAETILKVFTDLEMTAPNPNQSSISMNCIEVSKLLRVLFNSGYTLPEFSEYSMELLSQSTFSMGMKKGIPQHATLVHKFGERGYPNSTFQELSETGIIYLNNERILLTIMTKGNNQQQQAELISAITKKTCDWVENSKIN